MNLAFDLIELIEVHLVIFRSNSCVLRNFGSPLVSHLGECALITGREEYLPGT